MLVLTEFVRTRYDHADILTNVEAEVSAVHFEYDIADLDLGFFGCYPRAFLYRRRIFLFGFIII